MLLIKTHFDELSAVFPSYELRVEMMLLAIMVDARLSWKD